MEAGVTVMHVKLRRIEQIKKDAPPKLRPDARDHAGHNCGGDRGVCTPKRAGGQDVIGDAFESWGDILNRNRDALDQKTYAPRLACWVLLRRAGAFG